MSLGQYVRVGQSSASAPPVSGAEGIRGSHSYNLAHDLAGAWFPVREGNKGCGGFGVTVVGGDGLIPESLTSPSYMLRTR